MMLVLWLEIWSLVSHFGKHDAAIRRSYLQRGQLGAVRGDPEGGKVLWAGEGPHVCVMLSVDQHLNKFILGVRPSHFIT